MDQSIGADPGRSGGSADPPLFVVGGQLMVLRPPLLSDHSDEYCRLVALTYQEGDDMTLTKTKDTVNAVK